MEMTMGEGALGLEEALALDVALHAATLAAVLVYFGRGWAGRLRARPGLAALALLACVPAGVLYLAAGGIFETAKSSLPAVGAAFVIAGGFLVFASLRTRKKEPTREMSPQVPPGRRGVIDVVAIGCAQAVALFPGASRSGVTIGAGMLRGLTREAAFEFSFLAGAPLMAGALVVKARGVGGIAASSPAGLAVGAAVAFGSGLAALWALRRVVARGRLWAFGAYAVCVGLGCLIWTIGGGS
jgi:undecaprenyl-diphosphatase